MSQCSLLHNRRWVRQQEMRLCAVTGGRMIGLPQTCLYTGMYAGMFTIPTFSPLQRQYLLTCKVSRYCIFVPHGISLSCDCQQRTLSGIGHFRDVGPALKHYWINVIFLLVYFSSDVIDPDNVCVIGQGRLSRPMVCRRCRSASLRIFFTMLVAVVSDAIETHG